MKRKLEIPRDDLTGKKFAKLLVIRFSHYKECGKNKKGSVLRRPIWLCKCDCGVEKLIQAGSLKSGQVSCGCELDKYREWARTNFKPKNTKPTGEAAFNDLFGRYKEHARRVNVEFNLTKDQFEVLTKQLCFYCGSEPAQILSGKNSNRNGYNGEYIYNGIDRKDNNMGYDTNNCLPCCGICNKAKRNLTFDNFNIWIQQLIRYQTRKT